MPAETYHDRFIEACFHIMAVHAFRSRNQIADFIDVPHGTVIKIIDKSQKPTTEHCIKLCEKTGYSANWLFLGQGDMIMKRQVTLNEIYEAVNAIHKPVHKQKK